MHFSRSLASFIFAATAAATLSLGCASAVDPAEDDESVETLDQGLRRAKLGQPCGGIRGVACKAGLYCSFGAHCGASDQTGTCARKRQTCTREYMPVCGCDGRTYGNACDAAAAGVSVVAPGRCGPVCDPSVFEKVVAPELAEVQGVWTRVEGGLIQTRETLVLRPGFTYELTKTRGPNCKPMQPCPRIATLLWRSEGTFELEPGHGVQLRPTTPVPELAESFGVQKNCEGTVRLVTTELGVDVSLSKDASACVEDAECQGRDIGPNATLCSLETRPAKACNAESHACEWTCKDQGGLFCGGIAGLRCPAGLTCVLDGSYPDAGGTCRFCPIPMCAAPPPGCRYEPGPVTPGVCPSGCGVLTCDGTPEP